LPHTLLKEQKKIADCLSSIDDRITLETQKLDTLKAHKKGLMQQLFPVEGETLPKLRFPEFRDAGEWEERKLGELANFSSGGTPSKDISEYWNGNIPWISASSMYELNIWKSDLSITELGLKAGSRIAKKGSLLILVRGSMLHKRIPLGIALIDVAFNQDIKALSFIGTNINKCFLLYQLIAMEAQLLDMVSATGLGAGKLDTNELKQILVYIPNFPEQQKIADCLSSIDEAIAAQSQAIDLLKLHKKGLMQQLFPSVEEVRR
jgi:type I restriction enzyme S subunit